MTLRRLSSRICAVTAAYALALHVMLGSMAFAGHAAGDAPSAGATTCLSAAGAQPAGQDPAKGQDQNQASCVLHCLAVSGTDGWAPPSAGSLAKPAPAEIRITRLVPLELRARSAPKDPQSPRAPPLA